MGRPSDKAKFNEMKRNFEKMPAPAQSESKPGVPGARPGKQKKTDADCPFVSARPEQQKP